MDFAVETPVRIQGAVGGRGLKTATQPSPCRCCPLPSRRDAVTWIHLLNENKRYQVRSAFCAHLLLVSRVRRFDIVFVTEIRGTRHMAPSVHRSASPAPPSVRFYWLSAQRLSRFLCNSMSAAPCAGRATAPEASSTHAQNAPSKELHRKLQTRTKLNLLSQNGTKKSKISVKKSSLAFICTARHKNQFHMAANQSRAQQRTILTLYINSNSKPIFTNYFVYKCIFHKGSQFVQSIVGRQVSKACFTLNASRPQT